ncbi:MAG: hypothetical protein BLM47_09890 [Candidatus Reconcilbacillus cellulovorans]|uniref:Uncharacterized protein n=1 Tax=Candidatus Reconcilbacillus cellulovorans TaxID=1906605 RepID=A0A2A6DZF9_9BACL|nr:MAG: hypothetical protein BLM47_09890 [Candidatus Reconcilbacillus cellulovorans]
MLRVADGDGLDDLVELNAAGLVEVYFLLGEDEKAEAVWEQFRSQFRRELRVHAVGQLARARRTGDRAAALEIAKAFAEMIREEKTLVYYTAAGLTLWEQFRSCFHRRTGRVMLSDEIRLTKISITENFSPLINQKEG